MGIDLKNKSIEEIIDGMRKDKINEEEEGIKFKNFENHDKKIEFEKSVRKLEESMVNRKKILKNIYEIEKYFK